MPNREAALQAYADGAEYIHRTNDDISFMTPAWLTASVTALRHAGRYLLLSMKRLFPIDFLLPCGEGLPITSMFSTHLGYPN